MLVPIGALFLVYNQEPFGSYTPSRQAVTSARKNMCIVGVAKTAYMWH